MMERSLRPSSNVNSQRSNVTKPSNAHTPAGDHGGSGKDHASAAYDEYLWLLQKRNRLLKRLKTKDEQQVKLEKREQGFSVYINGANKDIFPSLPTSRRTKTADDHLSSRKLASRESLPDDAKEKRAKTAPTKLTRKEWKPVGFRMKTERGAKISVNVPGNITGIYSEDFDEMEDDKDSEDQASASGSEDENDSDEEMEELSLSFDDVHKLRRSLERDSRIKESIQTVIEDESDIESEEDEVESCLDKSCEPLAVKDSQDVEDLQDVEDISDEEIQEEIEEDLEGSFDLRDSNVLDDIPKLNSSYVIYKDKTEEHKKSGNTRQITDQTRYVEDTIVLSFSKSSRRPRLLSSSSRKKEGLDVRLDSHEDVVTAVRLENTKIGEGFWDSPQPSKIAAERSKRIETTTGKSSPQSGVNHSITDQTVAMVTKKVRHMNASQQKQLLDILAKLDPTASQSVPSPLEINRSIAFGSPENFPSQPLSSRKTPATSEPSESPKDMVEIKFEIKSNWGNASEIGLTEVQIFDDNGLLVHIPKNNIHLSNDVASTTSLPNLINGKTKTTNEKFMWKCPYSSKETIVLSFRVPCKWLAGRHNLSKIKVWNYNKKMKALSVGVKEMRILVDGNLVWDGVVDKGCGNQIYDYAEVISLKNQVGDEDRRDDSEVDTFGSSKDVQSEATAAHQSEEECVSPDIVIESSQVSGKDVGPQPIFFPDETSKLPPEDPESQSSEEKLFSVKRGAELPRKPPWLDQIKEKRNSVSQSSLTKLQCPPMWLDEGNNDRKKDLELSQAEDINFLKKPSRSRPSSGRRSCRNVSPESLGRKLGRAENGGRSADEPRKLVDVDEQLTKLTVDDVSDEENSAEQERWLEESLNSLSRFKKCHQGRITPSNKMEMNRQGDVLDDLVRTTHFGNGEETNDIEEISVTDDFVIPELPCGQRLVINILSTWGDQYYVGLNGVEVFNSSGKPVQISDITADPSDINILPEYSKDPRVVSNLIDGVYFTRDDMHLWLAPFTAGKNHFISIDFKECSTLAMIRIWNYNKSRIHSFRGAKDIEVFLDDSLIFRGEMARASGELGSSETFGDTILFTMNEDILEAMAVNDQTYEPDVDEDEDVLQTSNNFKRPVTADTGMEAEHLERPYTCPKERRKPTVEATYPNKVLEEDLFDEGIDGCSDNVFGQVLEMNLVSTWGDMYYLGLTGLQVLGAQGEVVEMTFDMLQANPRDLNDLPEYDDDDRTLDKLIDGVNITTSDEHMWLIPFTPGENHLLIITFKQPIEITGLRVWNYNKSPESTYRGVKNVVVKLDGRVVGGKEGILIRKGPGHCHFDFGQEISFLNSTRKSMHRCSVTMTDEMSPGDCELTVQPCGFVFQFQLFGSWGDPYYIGLNGLQFFDENGEMIELSEKNVTAYPESVNVLAGVKDDVRTPAKLIDGCNDTDDGRHMWLAPVFPGLTNLLYVIFNEPTTISMIKLWNYRKTPIRGVRQFSILVDDLLVFNGILPQVPTVTRGILPNMDIPVPHAAVLFTDDEIIRRKEKRYVINGGGFFENQEVCLMNDKTDFPQEKTAKEPDQALRPKTSVTHLGRTQR